MHLSVNVFRLKDGQVFYYYKACLFHLRYNEPTCMLALCQVFPHNQVCVGILSHTFLLLIRPAYKLWKLHHSIHCYIDERQLNEHDASEHNLISDVDILQCRAEQFDEGCHL